MCASPGNGSSCRIQAAEIVQQVAKENENGDYQSFIGVIFHPGELLDRLRPCPFRPLPACCVPRKCPLRKERAHVVGRCHSGSSRNRLRSSHRCRTVFRNRVFWSMMRIVVPWSISEFNTENTTVVIALDNRLLSDRPNPQPRVLVVKPGSKIRLKLLLGIPLPVSLTSM